MNSIFESLLLENHQLSEGADPSKKTRKECKTESKRLIRANHIKLESRRIFEEEEFDDIDDKFDVTPEDAEESEDDEVVLVIDPEAPADEEISDEAVEDMIGDAVYKCPVCGANYLCDCDSTENESVEVDENGVPVECPICGDDSEQILIGEIAPAEEDDEEVEMDSVDPDDSEDEVEEFSEEEVVEDSLDKSSDRKESKSSKLSKRSIKENIDEYDDDCGESCDSTYALTLDEPGEVEDDQEDDAPEVEIDADNVVINLDDTRLESFMNKVIRENYKQKNASFKVTKAVRRGNTLKLEYVVRNGKSRIKGTMVGEGLNIKSRRMMLKFKDKGAFTESFAKTPSFVVECIRVRNNIIPTSVRYDYKKRVNESLYRVSGKVEGKTANPTQATRRK